MRRRLSSIIKRTALPFILCCGGCTSSDTAWRVTYTTSNQAKFILGLIPYKDFFQTSAELEPLAAYIAKRLNLAPKTQVASNYEALGYLLNRGDVNVAWLPYTTYEIFSPKNDWEILCASKFQDKEGYRGVIIANKAAGAKTLQDLAGKRFAYVDKNSGSGFFGANEIFASQNIAPLTFFSSVTFTGRHSESLRGVIDGRFDAAAVYDDIIDDELTKEQRAQINVLAETRVFPPDLLVIQRKLPDAEKKQLRGIISGMNVSSQGRTVLEHLAKVRSIEGFDCRPSTTMSK